MHQRIMFDVQDVERLLSIICFSGEDKNGKKWDGTFVSRSATSNKLGESRALNIKDLDRFYDRDICLNFITEDGLYETSSFRISNENFYYVGNGEILVDYSNEWQSMLLKAYPSEYAMYLISSYKDSISKLKEENKKICKKMVKSNKSIEGKGNKNKNREDIKAIIKNGQRFKKQKLLNDDQISNCKNNINKLQLLLYSMQNTPEQNIEF